MKEYLLDVEQRLPSMLQSLEGWSALFVTYEKPHVERLFRNDGINRIYLHRIYHCDASEAFLHIHPWPSAIKVIQGRYEMRLGVDVNLAKILAIPEYKNRAKSFQESATMIIGPDTIYEMTNPESMHSVRPLTSTTLSLMVTGPSWNNSSAQRPLNEPLGLDKSQKLLQDFRKYYHG